MVFMEINMKMSKKHDIQGKERNEFQFELKYKMFYIAQYDAKPLAIT
jgi:hypothetical protein